MVTSGAMGDTAATWLTTPSCEEGYELVLRTDMKPVCAKDVTDVK